MELLHTQQLAVAVVQELSDKQQEREELLTVAMVATEFKLQSLVLQLITAVAVVVVLMEVMQLRLMA